MLNDNLETFIEILERASAQTGFPLRLLEKDYYLTMVLSRVSAVSKDLIFKGGTCLNKIYFSYFRLSEDLDFTLRLPSESMTRGKHRPIVNRIKSGIIKQAEQLRVSIDESRSGSFNNSTQHILYFSYSSAITQRPESIKFEFGVRANPLLPSQLKLIKHKFNNPFTHESLFDAGEVNVLDLKELTAEKLRAAGTRKEIAPRDFYDIYYLLSNQVDITSSEISNLFVAKLKEDEKPSDIRSYAVNLGRTQLEIDEMLNRVEEELYSVLTVEESKRFRMDSALELINKHTMKWKATP